ncbi:DnaJ-domain-containing protein [Rickenella mellea]|uniref:DnaJ-domain-containing protein n=1 Tax=Rickenella mellea TaxID=50990 RepID=A0A4Y7QJQ7_9AGAM|nr:DnaJ-domain-containing protein [Rickenella mellea]
MDYDDPISQFFPGEESVNLYEVLSLDSTAKLDDIKKSYRRLALLYHPDKHVASSDDARADASKKFQQIGFAYTVLSDEKRRVRYDNTGRTDEGLDLQAGEDGWEAYFADLFDRVTKGKLDEMKKEYQGSEEEVSDLKRAYTESNGSIEEIMNHIPHSTHDDEARFVFTITKLIKDGELPLLEHWESGVKDEKAKLARRKKGEAEAAEAEELAKELGVWDEFYGSGKEGKRKGKGKAKGGKAEPEGDDDHSSLQALILGKKKKMDGFFDNLAAKYADGDEGDGKNKSTKKRGNATRHENDTGARKKSKAQPPDIDDAEFEKLQAKLFGSKK